MLFLDDLQWAGRTPLGFVDLLLDEEPIEGLLLVGAYREHEVDAPHPLDGAAVPVAATGPACGTCGWTTCPRRAWSPWSPRCCTCDPAAAADLAEAVGPHTAGNPYETVELLNALRRDGVLTATADGLALGRGRPCAPAWTAPSGRRTAGDAGRGHAGAVPAAGGGDGLPRRAGRR